MIAKPTTRPSARATSTLTLGLRMLAATRSAVHRQRRPYSIKTRDISAIAAASDCRAKRNDRSELVISLVVYPAYITTRVAKSTKEENNWLKFSRAFNPA